MKQRACESGRVRQKRGEVCYECIGKYHLLAGGFYVGKLDDGTYICYGALSVR